MDNGTSIGTGTLSGGVATLTTTTLALGSHSIQASYAGDTDFAASTSNSLTQTVAAPKAPAITSANHSAFTVGLSGSFTVKASGLPAPTFSETGTLPSGMTLDTTSGVLSGVPASGTVGSYNLTFVASNGVGTPASQAFTLTIAKAVPGVQLNSIPAGGTVSYGQHVSLVATVSGNSIVATGTVTFMDGATVLGTGTVGAGGVAMFTTTSLSTGNHPAITAVYGGDSNFNTATSNALDQNVTPSATTTKLTKSTTTAVKFGQSVTFTATIAAVSPGSGIPTGTVTFENNGAVLGTATLSGGIAKFTTKTLSTGSHPTITAAYGGDSNFLASTSSAIAQTVTQSATTTTLTKNTTAAAKFGQSLTFTATMAAVSPGAGTPTGTIKFEDGATVIGTGALSGGVAKFTTTSLAVGSHSIKAVYSGDTNFTTSTSVSTSQTVAQSSTTTKLTKNTTTAIHSGQSVTFTATLAAVSPGAGTPTGIVTFYDNGSTMLGTGALTGGVTTFTTTTLPLGGNSITAVYAGDTNFSTSTSGAASQTVTS